MRDIKSHMRAAWRQQLLTLSKATTGTLSNVSVSGATYTRASGSFLTDGFGIGDEIVAAGFAQASNNGRALVRAVTALAMTVDRTLATEAAGANVSLVAGLPQDRHWEGEIFSPTQGRPFVDEKFDLVFSAGRGIGPNGIIEHRLLGVATFNWPVGFGTLAVDKIGGVCRRLFKRGTVLVYDASRGTVQSSEEAPLITGPQWLQLPVKVTITAFTSDQ